jgi:hypothetical protein
MTKPQRYGTSAAPRDDGIFCLYAEYEKVVAECERLRAAMKLQSNAAHAGMDAATRASSIRLELAEQARTESSPEVLASERAMNAMLTEENDVLRSARDVLQAACVDAVLALAHASLSDPVYQSAYDKVNSAIAAARGAK